MLIIPKHIKYKNFYGSAKRIHDIWNKCNKAAAHKNRKPPNNDYPINE